MYKASEAFCRKHIEAEGSVERVVSFLTDMTGTTGMTDILAGSPAVKASKSHLSILPEERDNHCA